MYGLTRLVSGQPGFQEIGIEQSKKIAEAKLNLIEILYIEEKFNILIENYFDLESTLLELSAKYMIFRNLDYEIIQNRHQLVNRRIINLLSSTRLYLDQTKHHFHNIFGKNSSEVKRFKSATNSEYDDNFSYRVMEALRNYVQHRGFPIQKVQQYSSRIGEGDKSEQLFSSTAFIKVDDLKADENFKKEVLNELDNRGEEINITPMIREYVSCIGRIQTLVRELSREDYNGWKQEVQNSIKQYQEEFGENISGLALVQRNEDGTLSKIESLFNDHIKRIEYFYKKNRLLNNLGDRFVSGRVYTK